VVSVLVPETVAQTPVIGINISPDSLVVDPGESAYMTVTVYPLEVPAGEVMLSVASNLAATVNPPSGVPPFTAQLFVQTSSGTPPGQYAVTVSAAFPGSAVSQATAYVTVRSSGGSFAVDISPSQVSIDQGESFDFRVAVIPVGGFSGIVTLSVSGGLDAGVGPTTGVPPFSAILEVRTTKTTTPGNYVMTVIAASGGTVQRAQAQVIVSKRYDTLTVYDQQGAQITFNGQTQTVPSNGYVTFNALDGTYSISTVDSVTTSSGVSAVFGSWEVPINSGNMLSTRQIPLSLTSDLQVGVVRGNRYLLTVVSQYGKPRGGGWYNTGAVAQFSVEEAVQTAAGTRELCTGFSGDATGSGCSGAITMEGPKTITFGWQLQYLLTVESEDGATTTGSGWYNAGDHAQFEVTPPAADGIRFVFAGWKGDYTGNDLSGTLVMNKPRTLHATWISEYLTDFIFTDANGDPLIGTPSQVVVHSPDGTEQIFKQYAGLWLDEGQWQLLSVKFHGVEVGDTETYTSVLHGKWTIKLQVYSLTVKVRGSLFSQGVDNIKIAVKLPDGTVLNAVTDSNGQAVIQQIPKGTYYVDAQGLVESKSVLAQVASNSSAVQLSMTAPIEIAAIATVVVVFIALVILFLRRRRRNDTLERKRIERRAVRAARS
jgi:hypothetical protein